MGVHGLTTYLKSHRSTLARTLHLPPSPSTLSPEERQPVIVDGWSLIYAVYRAGGHPWVYGGEYGAFEQDVRRLVAAWRGVGLEPVVVFDGATPQAKFPTVEKRLDQQRKDLLLIYRSGPAGRLAQAGTFVLPPLCYSSCLSALTTPPSSAHPHKAAHTNDFHPVEVHYADSEGDPYAVLLARQRAAWILGTDSDFIIYIGSVCGEGSPRAPPSSFSRSAREEGVSGMGYCPLDEMVWIAEDSLFSGLGQGERPDTPSAGSSSAWGEEDEFREVKPKRKRGPRSSGLLPPPGAVQGSLSLNLTFYAPLALAKLLDLPPTHLPLLASFLGTDYTPASLAQQFHPSSASPVEKVDRTARALRAAAAQQSSSGSATPSGYNRALDLIMRAIDILALRPPLPSGLAVQLREAIISSTLQYALPSAGVPGAHCAVHPAEACELPGQLVPSAYDDYPLSLTKPLYLQAYREGRLAPELVDLMATGSFWPALGLEDPDAGSAGVWVGRELRGWVYGLVEEAVGVWEEPEDGDEDEEGGEMEDGEPDEEETLANGEEDEDMEDEEDENELIPVEEMDSDEEPAWVAADKRAAQARARARAHERRETELYHGYLPENGVPQPENSPELRSLHAALWRIRGGRSDGGSAVGEEGGSAPLSRVMSAQESGSALFSPPNGRVRRVQVTEWVRKGQAVRGEKVDVRLPVPGELLPEEWAWQGERNGHYARRGMGRGDMPVILRSEGERVRVLLYALRAEGTGILDPTGEWDDDAHWSWTKQEVHLALSVRWAVMKASEKGGEVKWRKQDVRALAGVIFLLREAEKEPGPLVVPPLENRGIALTAQVLCATESVAWLAQALLLTHLCGEGESRFSGRAFHAALLDPSFSKGQLSEEAERWCTAVAEGLGEDVWLEAKRKEKKKSKGGARGAGSSSGSSSKGAGGSYGMFGALEGLPAE